MFHFMQNKTWNWIDIRGSIQRRIFCETNNEGKKVNDYNVDFELN